MTGKEKLILRRTLLATSPNCPRCQCKMTLKQTGHSGSKLAHSAALIKSGFENTEPIKYWGIICFQCKRLDDKAKDFANMPRWSQLKRRFDNVTGILTCLRTIKRQLNKWIWVNVRGGKLNGKG